MHNSTDIDHMRHALQLADKGLYITTPNPRVGCVVVKDGHVIGEGYTQPAGMAHAEVEALADATRRGVDVKGATVYVTLEPCAHYGRTPPCADALIKAGVHRVVVATGDPNPLVAGQGLARLQAAGVAVECGVLAAQARELNIGFFSRIERGRPWVRMKLAASLDGGTALLNGMSQWITSAAARSDGHAWRAQACAILTGIGTVQQDDPQLTVRAFAAPRQPRRVVVDSALQISPYAKVLQGGGTWIFAAQANPVRQEQLVAAGAEIIFLPDTCDGSGKLDLPGLMRELGRREINEVHVEAGFKLNGSLLKSGCVDELLVYLAPSLLGESQGMLRLPALTDLAQRQQLVFHDVQRIGPDLRIRARVVRSTISS